MPATLIDAETIMRAQRDANALGQLTPDELLTAAGIEVAAATREAAFAVDTLSAYGLDDRELAAAAFLCGLELGARCARLVP